MMHPQGGYEARYRRVGKGACAVPTINAMNSSGGHASLCPPYEFRFLLRRLQQRDVIRHRSPAHIEDAGELWILELHALGRLADKLHRRHHMHGDTGGAD